MTIPLPRLIKGMFEESASTGLLPDTATIRKVRVLRGAARATAHDIGATDDDLVILRQIGMGPNRRLVYEVEKIVGDPVAYLMRVRETEAVVKTIRAAENNTLYSNVTDSMIADWAVRDLVIISNLVDHHGCTLRPESAMELLIAAGKPDQSPIEIGFIFFRSL